MKVRIFAFDWVMGGGITVEDFCNHLKTLSGLEAEHKMIALSKKDGYWAGVLLSIKDVTAYCQMQRNGGAFTIEAKQLDENTQIADFNFFIINPTTGRGLYQHYHQSPVSNTFGKFVKKRYLTYRKQRIDDEVLAAGGEDIKKAEEKKIRAKYFGGLAYKTLLKSKEFIKCVDALKQIKMFAFELETITAEERLLIPGAEFAKRCSHKFFYQDGSVLSGLKTGIAKTLTDMNLKSASIKGKDENNEDVIYKLFHDYATFEEFEYNDIIGSVSFNSGNLEESLSNSKLIEDLLEIAARPEVKALLSVKAK